MFMHLDAEQTGIVSGKQISISDDPFLSSKKWLPATIRRLSFIKHQHQSRSRPEVEPAQSVRQSLERD